MPFKSHRDRVRLRQFAIPFTAVRSFVVVFTAVRDSIYGSSLYTVIESP